jgi:hypothetical protein
LIQDKETVLKKFVLKRSRLSYLIDQTFSIQHAKSVNDRALKRHFGEEERMTAKTAVILSGLRNVKTHEEGLLGPLTRALTFAILIYVVTTMSRGRYEKSKRQFFHSRRIRYAVQYHKGNAASLQQYRNFKAGKNR